jgi:ABC-type antimicrobial peptide transport system permease subunit
MIRNYFKIAFRNLLKNKVSSLINIGGLAVGMAVAMLIGLWIYDELSFNTYHQNYDRIGQVMTKLNTGTNDGMQYPMGTELNTNYAENFKHVIRSWRVQDHILAVGDKAAPEMLTLKMIHGSWSGLQDPYSIMLSASTSKAIFGDKYPINQSLLLDTKTNVKVTGVYEDIPLNSKFSNIEFLSPFELWLKQNDWVQGTMNDWTNHFIRIYAEINPNDNFERVSAAIKDAELKNLADNKTQAAQNPQVFLLPMSQWHLHNFNRGQPDTEPLQMVWIVGIIGAFVLLLACINFMNLSTARSEKRAKEVGIRKAIGSMRRQLINQFFSESFSVVIVAFALSLLLVTLLLPWFNDLSGKQMSILWSQPFFWLASFGFVIITGLLSGFYPALYLSSFQPVKVLKGTFRMGRFASIPRKVLVVTQFTVSVSLIISTIVIIRQVQVARDRPIGYNRDGVVMIDMKSDDFYGKYDLLRSELKKTGAVTEMSESMGMVTELASNNGGFDWKGRDIEQEQNFGTIAVTHEFGKTVGWQFIQGRDFSRDFPTDSSGIVINEAAAKFMNIENPVGEAVSWTWSRDNHVLNYKILGVIKDMIMESPYNTIPPTIYFIRGHNGGVSSINIKINPNISTVEALSKISSVFKKLVPSAPFDYKFADEEYGRKFAREERISKLATFFAVLAIFISCLGLFGLASFVAEQRTKEIGVRKVLGATVFNLWHLLSKDFVVLIVIAFFIAMPTAYYFMHNWLQHYQYRAEISWWIFAATGAGALIITLLTVSFQSIKAALMNPVKSLRTE